MSSVGNVRQVAVVHDGSQSTAHGRWTPGDGTEMLYSPVERDGALAEIGFRLILAGRASGRGRGWWDRPWLDAAERLRPRLTRIENRCPACCILDRRAGASHMMRVNRTTTARRDAGALTFRVRVYGRKDYSPFHSDGRQARRVVGTHPCASRGTAVFQPEPSAEGRP
jgi:hypothetical protein